MLLMAIGCDGLIEALVVAVSLQLQQVSAIMIKVKDMILYF